jgi:gluconolactonase
MQVEKFHHRFSELFDETQELAHIAGGFDFTEGPVWNPLQETIIFSDILGNSIYQWSQKDGLKKLRRNSYMANGNAYDKEGRLLTCEHATSRVTRTDFHNNGELEILASHYHDKQLNSPNDIICKSDGMIYFTDPAAGRTVGFGVPRLQELDFQGVYRLHPSDLSLLPVAEDFRKPNGLCFSADESRLFINDSAQDHIRVFDIGTDGSLVNGQVWSTLKRIGSGVADGMKIDSSENIYCCGPGGIHIFDAQANYLGIIHMPEQTANLCWGDDDMCSLYITATTSLYRVRTKIPGYSTFNAKQA